MSDKVKSLIVNAPVFTAGEQPPPAKLTALGAQLKYAISKLESYLGDLWDESFPYSGTVSERLSARYGRQRSHATGNAIAGTTERPLDIASIGRLIGPASALNPRNPTSGSKSITENIPAGVYSFQLRFPPVVTGSTSFINGLLANEITYHATGSDVTVSGAGAGFTTLVSPFAVNSETKWSCDSYGRVTTGDATIGGTITYTTNPGLWAGGNSPSAHTNNTIPDWNQIENGDGCTVTEPVPGTYVVTLPETTYAQSDVTGEAIELTAADPAYGEQLYLPKILTDNYSSNDIIPAGFIFLKNHTTQEVYSGATYSYKDDSSLYVTGVNLTDAIGAADKFYLITVGSDITTSIDDLRVKTMASHDRTFGEPLVEADKLANATKYPGLSGQFVRSETLNNVFPQYLHRDGWRTGVDDNLNDQNAMRGHIRFTLQNGSPGSNLTPSSGLVEMFGVWWSIPDTETNPCGINGRFNYPENSAHPWEINVYANDTVARFNQAGLNWDGIGLSVKTAVFDYVAEDIDFTNAAWTGDYISRAIYFTSLGLPSGFFSESHTIYNVSVVVGMSGSSDYQTWAGANASPDAGKPFSVSWSDFADLFTLAFWRKDQSGVDTAWYTINAVTDVRLRIVITYS